MDNQRRAQRFDVELEVEILHGGAWAGARTRNVSLGGCFVTTELRLTVGAKLRVRLRLPSGHTLEGDAIVRWPDDRGVGLQFDGLRARDVWALGKFLDSAPAS